MRGLFFCILAILPMLGGKSLELAPLEKTNHSFSFRLMEKLNRKDENFAFSPFAITTSLYSLLLGAKGLTNYEIEKILQASINQEKLPDCYRRSYQALMQPHQIKNHKSLTLLNFLGVNQSQPILPIFKLLIEKNFFSVIENIDFSHQVLATSQINAAIHNKVRLKPSIFIEDFKPSPAMKLLAINGAFYKNEWLSPFCKSLIYLDKFYPNYSESSYSHIPMLYGKIRANYYENQNIQALYLPLNESTIPPSIQAVFFIPKRKEISYQDFLDTLENKRSCFVEISIPIFSIDNHINLKQPLMEMGMIKPFTKQANFSGIIGNQQLYLSDVIHSCKFSINENGINTNQASSLPSNLQTTCLKPEKIFRANKPFYFMIYDLDQNYILFMGAFKFPIP